MGEYLSPSASTQANGVDSMTENDPFHVLIAGGGVVGLTIAQGCRENGIPFTIFERDAYDGERSQGWALTLHWCLDQMEKTIGPERADSLPSAQVTTLDGDDKGNFLFLDARNCEAKYRIPPTKRRLRLHRQKLRDVLVSGLDLQQGKKLASFETPAEGGVIATFADGSVAKGSILIGADGNNSNVRRSMGMANPSLNKLPVNLVGVVRDFTAEQAAPILELDPLLFQALDPDTGNYLWFSFQEANDHPDGTKSYKALVLVSWLAKDPVKDAIPETHAERIAVMKKRAANFGEPLRSAVFDIPDDLGFTTRLQLADFPPEPWDNFDGRVTLAGDAAHAMTMYRGEGANHGILDAALLVDQLKAVHQGKVSLKEAITKYEEEMIPRTRRAVLKSRRAALDAHEWDKVNDDSPCVGARETPESAIVAAN
ncbi:hypothetical protein A1O1_02145 [Capronia coronata CBS 617.96]|uniref:FAD-binding domain-containing protein n=1 Tax=Capronia coronata CBS 617.96 TaxID=1182541 RepID=W9YLH4_9EURO|nr:uncharacterized protein A1O1_02145 [Capronia coronata CBS 617.96]EXJ93752.1 hypothetical protein A1O1_02145 [Capronia coronata CBS 617.96]